MLDSHQALLEKIILTLDARFLAFELLNFLSFALPRRLRSLTISKYTLDTTLFLLIFCLGSFADGLLEPAGTVDVNLN